MSSFLKIFVFTFLLVFSISSCAPEKVCSGLNPEIGTYNTSKKIRKGKKVAHSSPEKEAIRRREHQMKVTKRYSGGNQGKKGGFHFHIGGKKKPGKSRSTF